MWRNREIILYSMLAAMVALAAFALCLSVSVLAAIIALFGCLGVYALCLVFTAHRYRKIAALADYLQRLSSGQASLDIRENAEGELSILKNEIYRVTTALTEQADALHQDKLELANALSDISHQLKTPLTSLGIMTDLLDNDNLPHEKQQEFFAALRSGQKRMEWLVLALLKLAKLDADAVALKPQSIPISSLIEKAAAALLIPIEIKGQTLSVTEIGSSVTLACDPEWTAEAIGNIIKNAVENTPQGGRIEIFTGANPLFAYIQVRDNGPGIDRADLPHLFKRFYRGKNAGPDSAGIGLSLSLAIMRRQNGDIEAVNDNGGVFTLKFYRQVT